MKPVAWAHLKPRLAPGETAWLRVAHMLKPLELCCQLHVFFEPLWTEDGTRRALLNTSQARQISEHMLYEVLQMHGGQQPWL